MKKNTTYPGAFQPPVQLANFHNRNHNHNSEKFPSWEMDRHPGMLLIRCWLPGVRREEIDLTIRNRTVYIKVLSGLQEQSPLVYTPIRYMHQFPLPEDADPLLIAAEYHRGMLCMRIPLASQPELVEPIDLHVVVY